MSIVDNVIKWGLKRRWPKIKHFMQHPDEVQKRMFTKIVELARNTEWGKKYHYKDIRRYEQFQERVPISSYEDLYPYIERMLRGEQNVLWSSKINWFAKSSGTTNARSKFIPVSRETLQKCHFRGGRDMLSLVVVNKPDTRFFKGKGLSIGGSLSSSPEWKDAHFGDVSAVIMHHMPRWAQYLRAPRLETAMMPNWEDKIEAMATETIPINITSALGVPTWTIVLFKRILEITGAKHIKEVWPDFEIFVHGAVAFQPYRELFDSLAPGISYMETYNASEGFFGLQDDFSRDDMLLMLDYDMFYEFIPLSEVDKEHPQTLTLEQVEMNKNYAMIISNSSGLWRYKIGDTVKFTSLNPFRVKITGRTKHFINAFGEEVIIENAETAITAACNATGAVLNNFTAGPIYLGTESKGGHEWIIEFARSPSSMEDFTTVLDQTLRDVNSDYDAKRHMDMALVKPMVHNVPEGTFYEWLKQRGKIGGQIKVPRLANSRKYLDEILNLVNSR